MYERMKPPEITNKQKEIILLIPKFRYLSRVHIQAFLHHKQRPRINRWLQDLSKKKYLLQKYSNQIVGKNRIPATYLLETNGIRYVRKQGLFDSTYLNKLYYDKNRSKTFITHCLFLATICLQLEEKQSSTLTYTYATVNEWHPASHPFHFLKENGITADLCFSKKQKGKKVRYYLLEIIDETLPRYRIRKRIRDYFTFFFSNCWEDTKGVEFPILLFVAFSKERMIYTKRYLKTIFREYDSPKELNIYVAFVDDVQTESITGNIWEEIT